MTPLTKDGPNEPQLSRWGGDKVSELETDTKNTQCDSKRRTFMERKQEEDEVLGGAVASGGALTDSKCHFVCSSSSQSSVAIQPCAHHSLLHHPDTDIQTSYS